MVAGFSLAFVQPAKRPDVRSLSGNVVLEWNQLAYEAMGGAEYQHSLQAARVNAMTHIAMHDALNAVQPLYKTYAFKKRDSKADPVAAIASAAHTILVFSFPDKKAMLDARLSATLSTVKDGSAKKRGIALGQEAAQSIIALRKTDGAAENPISRPEASAKPGVYQFVPPFDFVFAPHWKSMITFSLNNPGQFRCIPPPALNSEEYAKAFNEVKEYGRTNSKVRTEDQTRYAHFWYEFSEIGWNRVARTVAVDKKLNLSETARLMALLNMALADAYTAGWDSKYFYNFWRPYTAITHAAEDGNPATEAEQGWLPLLPTPPVQDHPSTHSALGNAGATVLASLLGDNTPFTMTSNTAVPAGYTRSFTSFHQAADENADSRIKAGIHFRFACKAGQDLGNKVGQWTVQNHLQPLAK